MTENIVNSDLEKKGAILGIEVKSVLSSLVASVILCVGLTILGFLGHFCLFIFKFFAFLHTNPDTGYYEYASKVFIDNSFEIEKRVFDRICFQLLFPCTFVLLFGLFFISILSKKYIYTIVLSMVLVFLNNGFLYRLFSE